MAPASCTNGTAQQKPGFDSCHPALSLLSIQSEGRSQKAVFVLFGVVALGLLSRGCKVVYAKVITGQLKTGLRRALHKRTLAVGDSDLLRQVNRYWDRVWVRPAQRVPMRVGHSVALIST